jgi:hypothetical protein
MARVIRLVLLVLVASGLASVVASPATADPIPAGNWPMCGTASDDDGQYCIVSVTKDGLPVPALDCGTPGSYEEPYVDLIGAGDVRFGLDKTTVDSGGCAGTDGDVDPTVTWQYVVNTGSIVPRELYGRIRNVTFSTSGGPSSGGYKFTLTFRPTPVSLTDAPCDYDGGCGDDTTAADYDYNGFVTGYVTDLASSGLSPSEIANRTGYVHVYSAQYAYEFYDADTNSIEVRMANTHLMADATTPVQGNYQSFLPDAMLVNELNVPDPTTLTTGSFSITRVGSGSAPATVTRVAGGVEISIPNIHFSNPRYRIHPKPTVPGTPRRVKVSKPSAHSAKVGFKRPLANGGAAITKYQARCQKGSGAWHMASAGGSPVIVKSLPRGSVACQVRAVNRLGAGPWSARRGS